MNTISLPFVRFLLILSAWLPNFAWLLASSIPSLDNSRPAGIVPTSSTQRSPSQIFNHSSPAVGGIPSSVPIQSGFAVADQCWKEWDAYSTSMTSCPETTFTEETTTRTDSWTSIIYETYKLCDGHPRASATGGERAWTSTGRYVNGSVFTTWFNTLPPSGIPLWTDTLTTTEIVTFFSTSCANPIPAPKCSINAEDCVSLYSAWTKGGFSRIPPPCTLAPLKYPCEACEIYVPSVRLIYFPVSMTGDFCGDCKLLLSMLAFEMC